MKTEHPTARCKSKFIRKKTKSGGCQRGGRWEEERNKVREIKRYRFPVAK